MSEPIGSRDAQRRVEQIQGFREQLNELVREGVLDLSADQRARLDLHLDKTLADLAEKFDVDISASQKQISLGMRILSTLGGLAFCAAVFFFFYRYWGVLTTPAQVGILAATPILCILAMAFASRHERTPYYTALIGLVAFAAFILELVVLGQIFNITPSPGIFLALGVFALVLAYTFRLRLLLAAGLVLATAYIAASAAAWSGISWLACLQRPEFFLPTGLAVALAPLIVASRKPAGFAGVYRLIGLFICFLALEVLMHGGRMSMLPLGAKAIEATYQVLAFAAAAAAIWLGIHRRLPETVNLGLAFFVVYLFDRLLDWWWNWMPKYLFFFLMGLIAAGLLAVFRRIRAGLAAGRTP